jgi:hypothetical protein
MKGMPEEAVIETAEDLCLCRVQAIPKSYWCIKDMALL